MEGAEFEAMLRRKLAAGQLSQREFDLILGTAELGEDAVSPDGPAEGARPEPSDQNLTFGDIAGLGEADQVWLQNEVKRGEMTVAEAVGLAKCGPEEVAKRRRSSLKHEADKDRYNCAAAERVSGSVYGGAVSAAAARLAELNAAALTLQAAVRAYTARKAVAEAKATLALQSQIRTLAAMQRVQAMADAKPAKKKKTARAKAQEPKNTPPPKQEAEAGVAPQPLQTKAPPRAKAVSPPSYLLQAAPESAVPGGIEYTLEKRTTEDGRRLHIGLDVTYKKAGFFGRGTTAVVSGVVPGSVADEAGIRVGDQIVEICSVKLTTLHIEQCKRLLREDSIRITVTRGITTKEQRRINKAVLKGKHKGGGDSVSPRTSPAPARADAAAAATASSPYDSLQTESKVATIVYDATGSSDEGGACRSEAEARAADEKRLLYSAVDRSGTAPMLPPRAKAASAEAAAADDANTGSDIYEVPVSQAAGHSAGALGVGDGGGGSDTVVSGMYGVPMGPGIGLTKQSAGGDVYEVPVAAAGGGGAAAAAAAAAAEESDQPVYEAPGAHGPPGSQQLYAPPEAAGGYHPVYEPLGAAGARAPALYAPTSVAEDDLELYEPTSRDRATGYGGKNQEPLYEVIPGEVVTPRHSRVPGTSALDEFLADEDYEEVAGANTGAAAGVGGVGGGASSGGSSGGGGPSELKLTSVADTEVVDDDTARTSEAPSSVQWAVVDLARSLSRTNAPEYVLTFAYDGEVQYKHVVGANGDGSLADGPSPFVTRAPSVRYTEVEGATDAAAPPSIPARNKSSTFHVGGSRDSKFHELRAALESAEVAGSPGSASQRGAEYAEYTELSTVGVSLEWYAGAMSKRECEASVAASDHGSFLVRESSKGDRFVLCVNDHGMPVNFPIDLTDDRKCSFGSEEFDNLHNLVGFLRKTAVKGVDGKPLQLTAAAPGGTVLVLHAKATGPPIPGRRPSVTSTGNGSSASAASAGSAATAPVGGSRTTEILGVKMRNMSDDEGLPPVPDKADLFAMLCGEMMTRGAAGGRASDKQDEDRRDSFSRVEYMSTSNSSKTH